MDVSIAIMFTDVMWPGRSLRGPGGFWDPGAGPLGVRVRVVPGGGQEGPASKKKIK